MVLADFRIAGDVDQGHPLVTSVLEQASLAFTDALRDSGIAGSIGDAPWTTR